MANKFIHSSMFLHFSSEDSQVLFYPYFSLCIFILSFMIPFCPDFGNGLSSIFPVFFALSYGKSLSH